ncbi:CopG family transcriptional regulator [Prosthecobacter fusiformis]|uniref:Putative nickel-responsive regulator n=1 Tax=Prosthecobacter fusiformis TaxID=48464 RepID=A0A4R7RPF5_9BACT|nr:nickel-responsive transcriptional regulator NikR [Prosthecobacter fusiformis]TDU67322.1 CopG family transcriptional regulator [Prosthecobacter fusiformis]
MPDKPPKAETFAQRVTISLPDALYQQFEQLMEERGFQNRSQAISEVLSLHIADYYSLKGNSLMAGTITLFYDHKRPGLKQEIADIQHDNIRQVISSLHVLLENSNTMEVILVQGPAKRLRQIANKLLSCKGVLAGRLNLSRTLMPPIQTQPDDASQNPSAD